MPRRPKRASQLVLRGNRPSHAHFAASCARWQNRAVTLFAIRAGNAAPAILALLALAACARLQPGPAMPPQPACPHVPPPPAEKPPLPPVSAFPQTLQPGHWEWDTSGYVWHPPHWQARLTKHPPPWLDGYWAPNGGACVWHNGRYLYGASPK